MMLAACDHIAEGEQLIYDPIVPASSQDDGQEDEESKSTKRVVLLEDFTGQKCVNCPNATNMIEQLHNVFGDALVAVGIHGGPLGFAGNARSIGLATDLGNEYYNYWNLEYQPIGVINRHGAVNYTDWATAVNEELAKPDPLHLFGVATIEAGTINITIDAEGKDGTVAGKLQVWLLEDGIKALQMMPDGTANQQYIHNHVLRTAVNGAWGEDISVREGETVERTMTQTLDQSWNKDNLSIVAFVYNGSGVQQTTKFAVELEE